MKHYLTGGKEKQGYDIIKKGKQEIVSISPYLHTNKIINKVTAALVSQHFNSETCHHYIQKNSTL